MGKFAEQEEKKVKKDNVKPTAPVQETVQRDLSDVNGPEGGMLPGDVSAKIQSMRGSGQKLSERQNQFYSQKFGRDMSDVHVHTDAQSDTVSRSLNARAFTIGSDVFLSKGINPDGGGRDAETMTHELTHVVQQGGHASSGPLKLGAADTAQEHEAEATAQREFDPKLKEDEDGVQREFARKYTSSNTIQRGFWGDLGTAIGGAALNAIGLGEAMGDFMSGDNKIKAAIEKMPGPQKLSYKALEDEIKRGESAVSKLEKQVKKDDKGINAIKKDPSKQQELTLRTQGMQQKQKELSDEKTALDNNLKQQLAMLQSVDATITTDDVNRYRSGKAKTFFSSIFAAIGGKVLGAFASDPEQKAEAQAKGRNSINSWFASKNKTSVKGEDPKQAAAKAEEIEQRQKGLVDSIWNDVQKDAKLSKKYTKLIFKREIAAEHMTMIQESIKDGESDEDIKSSIIMLMRNKAGVTAGNGQQEELKPYMPQAN